MTRHRRLPSAQTTAGTACRPAGRAPGPAAPRARNRLWQSLALRPASVQRKPNANHPGDAYEQEADRVAEQVMRLSARQPAADERSTPSGPPDGARRERAPAPNSTGRPLDPGRRTSLEGLFDHDFGHVRIHTDEHAARAARGLGALAFTSGADVYFARGQYSPGSPAGRRLLAHELTHVIQQGGGAGVGRPVIQRDADPKADRKRRLKEFRDAVKASDWNQAALTLNGLDDNDIDRMLSDLSGDQLRSISNAADEVMKGWPPRVQDKIKPLLVEVDRVAKLKVDYDQAVSEKNWQRAALLLNGFSESDIKIRLRRLSVDELKLLDAGAKESMPTWYERVHRLVVQQMLAASPVDPAAAPGTATRAPSLGSTAPPSAEEMEKKPEDKRAKWQNWLDTRDAKAVQFGAADYEDYVRNMLVSGGSVFGQKIAAGHPVHPLFLDRLEAASEKARAVMTDKDFGVRAVSGQDNRPGNHAWGLAVDIDADSNPYIMNEAGESTMDAVMAPIYERIAQALLHRASVITPGRGLEKATYSQLAEESDAMAAYFSVLKDANAAPGGGLPARRNLTGRTFDPADLQKLDVEQVKKDYATLSGPKPEGTKGDTPFVGGGPGKWRDPARGFLSLRMEVVEALRGQGLRWGATDFPGASGDVMHFDDDSRHADYVEYGKTHQTAKRRGGG